MLLHSQRLLKRHLKKKFQLPIKLPEVRKRLKNGKQNLHLKEVKFLQISLKMEPGWKQKKKLRQVIYQKPLRLQLNQNIRVGVLLKLIKRKLQYTELFMRQI